MTTLLNYYYCNTHDDAFFYVDNKNANNNKTKISRKGINKCNLIYIGYRLYNCNGTIELDTTPPNSFFIKKGGAFEKEYLENVDEISIND